MPQTHCLWLTSTCSSGLDCFLFGINRPHFFPPSWRDRHPRGTHASNFVKKSSLGICQPCFQTNARSYLRRREVPPPPPPQLHPVGQEQQKRKTESKYWCKQKKVSLHDWLRSLQALGSDAKDCLDEIPYTSLSGPGGVATGSIYWGEAYWHLCWVLTRSTGFRK